MRSKELKLKKWEQDLELKEKLLNENSKDRTKLMSCVTKLENQNQELNMHIMTLQKRIEQIEEKTTHKVQTNNPQHNDYHTINQNLAPDNNSLLHSIQDRVTSFVLKQIDKQLQQLENNMVTTITEQKKVILIQNVKVPIQSRNLHLRSSILMIMPEMGNLH